MSAGTRHRRTRLTGGADRIDALVGRSIEEVVLRRHERRLGRLGWERALHPATPGWASRGFPRRAGNDVELLVDGASAFAAMAEAVAAAESHVHLAAWHLAPSFGPLPADGAPSALALLARAAEQVDVRVVAWEGPPVPGARPTRWDARRTHEALAGAGIRSALERLPLRVGSIHEKLLVVDDRVAFVGGLEFTDVRGDRLDTSAHPWRGRGGWHDAAVRVAGPVVADLAAHFGTRWRRATGEPLGASAAPAPAGGVEAQVVRTMPEGVYDGCPAGEFGVLEAYLGALAGARRLIYLESQFLWSVEVVRVLEEKLRAPPGDDFRVVLVLPVDPRAGIDDTQGQLRVLAEADAGAGRLVACSLQARAGAMAHPVYVHAKLGVVDDEWLTVGSANLNDLSFFNSTEVNVVVRDAELARAARERLWAEHLELPGEAVAGDPVPLVDGEWRAIADEQLERRRAGAPPTHRLVRLPGRSRRSKRLLGPVQNLAAGA